MNLNQINVKKVLPTLALVLSLGFLYAFVLGPDDASKAVATTDAGDKLEWMSWEEMVEAQEKEPRKVLVDVYTDWCGWCKRMDQTTFSDPAIESYLKDNFYAVKFDAEQKEDIIFKGHTLKFKPSGRRGSHELAVSLLNGRMSYPSLVYLNENLERITISPGYKGPEDLMPELEYIAGEHYISSSFDEFKSKGK
ncbi:MAG: DUF255 domain-containing protein [Bacteroidetes bacterium]|nr:DUF255 domain-containing protein [Bacteroidota bacterium]